MVTQKMMMVMNNNDDDSNDDDDADVKSGMPLGLHIPCRQS